MTTLLTTHVVPTNNAILAITFVSNSMNPTPKKNIAQSAVAFDS